jgi:TusA-related sulfurtransferase
MNYVKAKLFLEAMAVGGEAEFLLNDGEAVRNVPRSLRDDGHDVLELEREDAHYVLRMRRCEERDARNG